MTVSNSDHTPRLENDHAHHHSATAHNEPVSENNILLTRDKRGVGVNRNIKREDVITALEKTHGNVTAASRLLGCTRANVFYYIKEYDDVRLAYEIATDVISDIAEGHLIKAVVQGDMKAVQYWLNNKARHRGYGRTDGGTTTVNVNNSDGAASTTITVKAIDFVGALAPLAPLPEPETSTPRQTQRSGGEDESSTRTTTVTF